MAGSLFFSPLNEQYTHYAYVENNPVEANKVKSAIDYQYSSARHYVGMVNNKPISDYDLNSGITKQASPLNCNYSIS